MLRRCYTNTIIVPSRTAINPCTSKAVDLRAKGKTQKNKTKQIKEIGLGSQTSRPDRWTRIMITDDRTIADHPKIPRGPQKVSHVVTRQAAHGNDCYRQGQTRARKRRCEVRVFSLDGESPISNNFPGGAALRRVLASRRWSQVFQHSPRLPTQARLVCALRLS